MSYLELPGGIADFTKAVISFWFRVPATSIQSAFDDFNGAAADAEGLNWGWFTPPFNGVVPLIAFGSPEVTTADSSVGAGKPITPSYIGIDTRTPANVSSFHGGFLAINLQMSTQASGQTDTDSGIKRPDAFFVEGHFEYTGGAPNEDSRYMRVTPDHWHHVLVSFDIKSCAVNWDTELSRYEVTSAGDFWLAFDDVNYTGTYLEPSSATAWATTGTPSANAVITQGCVNIDLLADAAPTWTAVPVKSNNHPVGIPSAAVYVANVYPVELAELQFFTDVTLDTSVEANRRAFITASSEPDPENPAAPITGGKPADPAQAQTLLGTPGIPKMPAILLHGSGDWIAGINTGPPMIPNPDYNPGLPEGPANPQFIRDPDKQFTSTGRIDAYTPDPSLHGPQSPASSRVAA